MTMIKFAEEHNVDPAVLFNSSMPSSILGQEVGGKTLLDAYADHLVNELPPRLRIVSGGGLSGGEVREALGDTLGSEAPGLLMRWVDMSRLAVAEATGTDRDRTSGLSLADAEWEAAAMQANGIPVEALEEVTFAAELQERVKCNPRENDALLIYYAGALKLIEPNRALARVHSNNFRAFLRPDLKAPSLVAVVTRE